MELFRPLATCKVRAHKTWHDDTGGPYHSCTSNTFSDSM